MAGWDVARISQHRFAAWDLEIQTPAPCLYDGSRRNVAARRLEVEAGQRDDRDAKAHRKPEPERHADPEAGERPRTGGHGHPTQRLAFAHRPARMRYHLLAPFPALRPD